uniref:Uncharacterized protein n=1 Tax=Physcomitrium patens TaxID=3218 RepID=A9REQ8_PHYPA|nr:hypothetical protein PHYPA_017325 [Physcomitrium patens]
MDQHSVKSLGLITNLPFIVNCIIVTVDFYFLEIIDSTGRYLVILGRPWLTEVNAVNNWKPGKLKIGPRRNRVRIRVMKRSSSESEGASSPEESSGDSVTRYLDTNLDLPTPIKLLEISELIQFGPTLSDMEKSGINSLIEEFSGLLVTRYSDLPAIKLE